MNIALINLPWEKEGRLGVRAGSRWPFTSSDHKDGHLLYTPFPFFLAYATALLKTCHKNVKLFDCIAEGFLKIDLIKRLQEFFPQVFVFETSTPSFLHDIELLRYLHQIFPKAKIILCGPHASVFSDDIMKKYFYIDFIIMGEYEYSVLNLVNALDKGQVYSSINGLVYREKKMVVHNSSSSSLIDLDDLPWPERGDVPLLKYNDGFAGLPTPNIQVLASRGCPFDCSFCLWPQAYYQTKQYRKRNPIDVVDEIQSLIDAYPVKAIYFDDDTFNVDKKFVLDICSEIKKRSIDLPWGAMGRVDLMDDELIEAMASSGLFAIKYGIESASKSVQHSCGKNIDIEKSYEIIQKTKLAGIKVHLTFCLGLPGETQESVQKTIRYIKRVHPDSLQFSFATPFPGTKYYDDLQKSDYLLSDNWNDYDGNCKCLVRTEALSQEDLMGLWQQIKTIKLF